MRVMERLANLLRAFRERVPEVGGHGSPSDPFWYAVSESTTWGELRALWTHAQEQGHAGFSAPLPDARAGDAANRVNVWLTLAGHAWLESLDAANLDSAQGFVARWFGEEMGPAASAIARGIEAAGFRPMDLQVEDHADDINDKIIAEIRRSRFMVADFTGPAHAGLTLQRGGVYYEAGLARGLGLPVIWTCRRDQCNPESLHFDVRQFAMIDWATEEELARRLRDRIGAVIGPGPIAPVPLEG